ncbi:hypothetical protein HDG34_006565 [Paraburkholderia sp. HC6.4b]|uniref:hypothetical protein n=1 Tax=unclassified Paraburkholderia TaxID=2615204 RepID=UPI0016135626|nr:MULTISPECIES: hypothetical protein [unclassified Paraburkholderia]MBB5412588.1 hypothetical protein [Paraburkholderia sp. HC6.4b]MBB5454525.1 hypothetical protein [Paraburkholderia sp. Kb1A]
MTKARVRVKNSERSNYGRRPITPIVRASAKTAANLPSMNSPGKETEKKKPAQGGPEYAIALRRTQ